MASGSEDQIHEYILTEFGMDTRSMEIRTVSDQMQALATDVLRVRAHPLLPRDLVAAGAVFDVKTGRLSAVEI
jgi:carbonic anhydrase